MDVVAGEVARRDRLLVVLGLGAVRAGQVGRAADQLRQRRDKLLERQLRPDARRALGGVGSEAAPSPRRSRPRRRRHARRAAGRAFAILAVAASQALLPRPLRLGAARRRRRATPTGSAPESRTAHTASRASRARPRSPRRRAVRRARTICRPCSARRSRSWSCRRSATASSVGLRLRCAAATAAVIVTVDAGRCSSPKPRSASSDRRRPTGSVLPSIEIELSSHSTISLPSLEVTGERDGFLADAFHQAAVAGDDVRVVIDEFAAERAPPAAARESAMPTALPRP